MPELPDILAYVDALDSRLTGRTVEHVRLASPFLLRSVEPPLTTVEGRRIAGIGRVGKRLVVSAEGELHLVIHLMIAGRLRWLAAGAKIPGRIGLFALDVGTGTLVLTEAGTTRRASLHLVAGAAALAAFDRGGLDVLSATTEQFTTRLRAAQHTLKRSLTDPTIFDGIGNAYSDEILHAARLSPLRLTRQLSDAEAAQLHEATRTTLHHWIDRLRRESAVDFPTHVTAFRDGMAVHGRYGQPCPDCGAPVQRIRYASNETNYCARCQTGGRLLADRAMSRLLKGDWPRTLEEME